MNKAKRRTDTREAVRALVRSVHGLTKEVSILRRYILEMRSTQRIFAYDSDTGIWYDQDGMSPPHDVELMVRPKSS